MQHREPRHKQFLTSVFRVSSIYGMLGCLLVTLLLPLVIIRGTTYASGEQYVFNFDSAQKAALDSCMQNHNCTRDAGSSDLYNIAPFAKGGVYGSSPIQLNYEPNVATNLLKSDEFAFTGNYNCGKDITASILMTVDMGSLDQLKYPARVFIDNIRNNSTGEDTSYTQPGSDFPLSYANITQGAPGSPSAKLPTSCLPSGLNTPANGDFSGSNKVNLFNYTKLNATQKNSWGPTVANPNYQNPNTPGGPGSPSAPTCDNSGFSLSWALCPLISGIADSVSNLYKSLIQPLLTVKTGDLLNTSQPYYQVWSTFRVYGDILLVIALLVIVFGESIGGGLIDAYTAKKILPRLLIAVVLINLSIYLVALSLDLTNILGQGIYGLLTAPFNFHDSGLQLHLSGLASAGIITGAIWAIASQGFIHLLLMGILLPALLIFIAILVTLLIRQALIYLLVFVSPIAFAFYCLPNTEQYFRRWWDTLFRTMMIYPIISALFAAANILAATMSNIHLPGIYASLAQVLAMAALFAPLALIPFAFRFAGGIIGQIHQAAQQRLAQPGLESLRESRAKKRKENMELMQSNRRFNPNRRYVGGVSKRVNTALSNLTSPGAAAKIYGGMAIRRAGQRTGIGALEKSGLGLGILDQINQSKFDHSQKLGEKLNALGFNDRALRSLMEMDDFSTGAIRTRAAEMARSENPNDRLAAAQLNNNAAFLGQTLNSDPEMGRADIGVAAGLAVTAQGFSDTEEVVALANKKRLKGTGLGTTFVTQAQLNGQRAGRIDMKPGYGIQIGENGEYFGTGLSKIATDEITGKPVLKAKSAEDGKRAIAHQINRILTTSQSEIQTAKGGAVRAMAPGFEQLLKAEGSVPKGDDGRYEFKYRNETGQEETLRFSPSDVERVAAMLGTAQADYSGTAALTNAEIQKVIEQSNLSGQIKNAYNLGRRQQPDNARISGLGEPPQPQGGENPPA